MFDYSRDEHVVRECYDRKEEISSDEYLKENEILSPKAVRRVKIAAFAILVAALLSFIFITNSVAAADCRTAIIESAELMNRAVTMTVKARTIYARVVKEKTADGKYDKADVAEALSDNEEYTALRESIKDAKIRIRELEKTVSANAKDGSKAYELYKKLKRAYEQYVVNYVNPSEFANTPVDSVYKDRFESYYQTLMFSVR